MEAACDVEAVTLISRGAGGQRPALPVFTSLSPWKVAVISREPDFHEYVTWLLAPLPPAKPAAEMLMPPCSTRSPAPPKIFSTCERLIPGVSFE